MWPAGATINLRLRENPTSEKFLETISECHLNINCIGQGRVGVVHVPRIVRITRSVST